MTKTLRRPPGTAQRAAGTHCSSEPTNWREADPADERDLPHPPPGPARGRKRRRDGRENKGDGKSKGNKKGEDDAEDAEDADGVGGVLDEFTSPWWGDLGPVGALGLIASAAGFALWTYLDLPGSPDIPATTYHEASRVAAIGLVVGGTWAVSRWRSGRRRGTPAADRQDDA
ncbi:hypothetical protein RM844_30035 [Streptomyces sp. DSM 44915]|uniref:Integral membrane protein n=1 Tax=Streptomyces chisholmiae TaxID=3075540 RepID=A0ABU2JZU4_9ACTN|nr:hypothetical protein [Streptomyces sp. DSM 44915]MDT0270520.1 hypothetical protein [Streptomyces sp. DSM 44915]